MLLKTLVIDYLIIKSPEVISSLHETDILDAHDFYFSQWYTLIYNSSVPKTDDENV